jgi:2-polyprenyl-3-methyl-5-hydroxy-6-metoxy-1,4-benzoquinol methylase
MADWDEKTQVEIAHQAQVAASVGQVSRTPDHIIERFRRCRFWWVFPKEYVFKSLGQVEGKQIFDFGCGTGEISTQLARMGAYVTGMDISPELIETAKQRASLDGVQDRMQFIAGDISKSPLPENKFDALVCFAVLHHLDFHSVLPRLLATLKSGGLAVILEPIAFSPLLQKIRDNVPIKKDADPIERQLNKEDWGFVMASLADSHATFFNLFGRLNRLLPAKGRVAKGIWIALGAVDRFFLVLFPFLSRFYGTTAIVGRKRADS